MFLAGLKNPLKIIFAKSTSNFKKLSKIQEDLNALMQNIQKNRESDANPKLLIDWKMWMEFSRKSKFGIICRPS